MHYKSKYVIFDNSLYAVPVIFSEFMNHNEVAAAIQIHAYGGKPISAGFCFIEDGKYKCYGESKSLRIKSRPEEDARILNKYLGVVADE